MLLFYLRHGDPIYSPDSLTPLGQRQAEALGRRLAQPARPAAPPRRANPAPGRAGIAYQQHFHFIAGDLCWR